MKRVVMINWLPEMLHGRARWYTWYVGDVRSIWTFHFGINDVTLQILLWKWLRGSIDMLTVGSIEFYNSENASVIVAAMEKVICIKTYQVFGWLKFRFQVDCLEHGNVSKTMTNAGIYHVKEPNLMRRVSWLWK